MHFNEDAYQPGKSGEIVLHQLVTRIKTTINNREMAVMVALMGMLGEATNTYLPLIQIKYMHTYVHPKRTRIPH